MICTKTVFEKLYELYCFRTHDGNDEYLLTGAVHLLDFYEKISKGLAAWLPKTGSQWPCLTPKLRVLKRVDHGGLDSGSLRHHLIAIGCRPTRLTALTAREISAGCITLCTV